ncbi:MAG: sensor histidine kinase [Candidatus Saccharimonadales bacterium]
MFRSATFKLTIWYLAIAMTISVLFSAVVYDIGAGEIARGIQAQTDRIYSHFPIFYNYPVLHPDSDIDISDHHLLLKLAFLNIIVFMVAGIASYLLAKGTLQPIEEAHEQQKRFTSDVSHELRTPLTALKMESEVALMNPEISKSELKSTLKSNLEEVTKLERLINNILKLSRLEASELKQTFGSFSAKQAAEAALKQVKTVAKQRNIKVISNLSDQSIYGDQDSITQLLVILLDNAIKYSHESSEVSIDTLKDNNHLIFKVTDHGIGIEDKALQHIFDRFYISDSSRSKKDNQESYGLGLSIAKMIADLHEATITVSSKVGKGTIVEVSLPINKDKTTKHKGV